MELESNFVASNDKLISPFIDTPLFHIGEVLKAQIKNTVKYLNEFIIDDKFLLPLEKTLSKLSEIFQSASKGFNTERYSGNFSRIINHLITYYEEIETKTIDDYISEQYNKHLEKTISKENNKYLIDQIQYLERSFLEFEDGSKKMFIEDLKTMDSKFVDVFADIKKIY